MFPSVLHRARAKFRLMQRLGIDTMLVCSNVATATVDDDAGLGGPAAPARRRGRGARRPARLRGPGVGPVRRRLPTRMADRRARRPPGGRRVPGQLPHPVPRPRPRRDRGDPRREDLLPPARRRARADDGRAVVEPAPPAVPGRGCLRPGRVRRPRADGRIHRTAVARGLQRHVPPDRRAADGPAGQAFADLAGRTRSRRAEIGADTRAATGHTSPPASTSSR